MKKHSDKKKPSFGPSKKTSEDIMKKKSSGGLKLFGKNYD